MKLICLLAAVLLTGCARDVPLYAFTKGTEVCKNNGNLSTVYYSSGGYLFDVTCSNGATFSLYKEKQ